jgi:hypothetical protein
VLLISAFATAGGPPFGASAPASSGTRLAVSWPGTGFVGYGLVIRGRSAGLHRPVSVVLQRRQGHSWRLFGYAAPHRSGAFVVVSRRAGEVGAMKLRLVVRGRSAVLARRFATVRIRPLPIVIPPGKVLSVPPTWEGGGWIRFVLPTARSARAAGTSRCPRVPTGPTVYKNNFVAVGYNARTSPHGFLGLIQRVQCKGRTGRIRASGVGLGYAVEDGSLDLARFVQKAGLSSPTSAQKSFSYTFDDVPCSPGAPATLSGSVDLNVVPRLTMQFAHDAFNDVSSDAFTVTGSATVAVAVDAKAGAICSVSLWDLGGNDNSIATLQGQVGPFPVGC